MPRRARERTEDAELSDLISIADAARMLDRSTETLRKWSQQVPPRLVPYRDGITKTRYFRRGDVLALMPQKEA